MSHFHSSCEGSDSEEGTSDADMVIIKRVDYQHRISPPSSLPSSDSEEIVNGSQPNIRKMRGYGSPHSPLPRSNFEKRASIGREGVKQVRGGQSRPRQQRRDSPSRRVSYFFQHDLRLPEEEEEDLREDWEQSEQKGGEMEGWTHDMFVEEEQQPKSRQEIVETYGYDIRSDSPVNKPFRDNYAHKAQLNRKWRDDQKSEERQTRQKFDPKSKDKHNQRRPNHLDGSFRSGELQDDEIYKWKPPMIQNEMRKGFGLPSPPLLVTIENPSSAPCTSSNQSSQNLPRNEKPQLKEMKRFKLRQDNEQVLSKSILETRHLNGPAPIPDRYVKGNKVHIPLTLSKTVLKVLAEDDSDTKEGSWDTLSEPKPYPSSNFLSDPHQLSLAPLSLNTTLPEECEEGKARDVPEHDIRHRATILKNNIVPRTSDFLLPSLQYYYPRSQTFYQQGGMNEWTLYRESVSTSTQQKLATYWPSQTLCHTVPISLSCRPNSNSCATHQAQGVEAAAWSNWSLSTQSHPYHHSPNLATGGPHLLPILAPCQNPSVLQ